MGAMAYTNGANLGGWLVMENWLFPNVPLLRLGLHGSNDNQEWDYIARLCERGMDAVATMHRHWNTYLSDDLLHSHNPPQKLLELRQMGVNELRIPVGWWAFMPPESASCDCFGSVCHSRGASPSARSLIDEHGAHERAEHPRAASGRAAPPALATHKGSAAASAGLGSYAQPGVTADGFVTGGAVYLRALLAWCGRLNMTAVIDMHALPGGAVKNMGYTGRYFSEARFFTGADAWHAEGNSTSLPSPKTPYLRSGVISLLRLARFIAALEKEPSTQGVVTGLAPWNEALFSDDSLAAKLLPPFALKLLWAPLVDAVYSSRFGRRKTWIVPVQAAIGVLLSELTDKFRPYPVSEFAHLQEQLRARGVESLAGEGSVMGAGSMLRRGSVPPAPICARTLSQQVSSDARRHAATAWHDRRR